MRTRLFSYTSPLDDGAAPNPYWGVCTLAICQPQIRLTAEVGDWIVGIGSKSARTSQNKTKDISRRVVYAMRVTRKLTMRAYDQYTQEHLTGKIPDWGASDPQARLGDSIYHWDGNAITQRPSVHGPSDKERDLSGKFALLSDHFYYFGAHAVPLPFELRPIGDNQRAHRMTLNAPFVDPFIAWLGDLGHAPGSVLGEPLFRHDHAGSSKPRAGRPAVLARTTTRRPSGRA